jgi:hypothetical protein
MQPHQESYDTFSRWMMTRMRANMASEREPAALHWFFAGLYEDMLANPAAYSIPEEPFITFFARVTLSAEETAQHGALKAARLRVRKVVLAYLEFLYRLGQAGTPAGGDLHIPQAELKHLTTEYRKKARVRSFPSALERSGLYFAAGDPVVVSNHLYPGAAAELAAFSQACARTKDFGFYLFRRCDQAVFDGKSAPDLSDAIMVTPQPFRDSVAQTDERLQQLRFKREIFADDGDMSYRVRYSKKGDLLVYWLRIQETFEPALVHYLRWKLESDVTARLFRCLDQNHPGLADRIFDGLKSCAHCYGENCMDRKLVERNGVFKAVCQGGGLNHIGYSPADYENLWLVLAEMDKLVTGKG